MELDKTQAEMHSRSSDLITANETIMSLQNQLTTAQNRLVEALQTQLHNRDQIQNTTTRRPLLKDPSRFAGDQKDSRKRYDAFLDWKNKILLRWRQDSHEFPTQFSRILHASSLLEGSASHGIQTELQVVLDNEHDDTIWPWKTGGAFLEALNTRYNTVDLQMLAEQRLQTLSQSDEFAIYADFINEFQQLADRAGWDNSLRVFHLQTKVNRKMREAIGVQAKVPAKNDLSGWLELLRELATRREQGLSPLLLGRLIIQVEGRLRLLTLRTTAPATIPVPTRAVVNPWT
ncbi:MAG: hypothetical protein JWP34_4823 [Massilia sp.]|nr:hypothetical protein [Massilia sp.]